MLRFYQFVDEPRVHRIMWSVQYLLLCLGGVFFALLFPKGLQEVMPDYATFLWGTAMTVGGAIGSFFCLKRFWLFERVAIWLTGGSVTIYIAASIFAQVNGSGSRWLTITFAVVVFISLVRRFFEIHRYPVEPGY